MNLSQFGMQMSQLTGVRAIMKDIIETLRNSAGQEFINLSAGNPRYFARSGTIMARIYGRFVSKF